MKTLEIPVGKNIDYACDLACKIAHRDQIDVGFNFNGVNVIATPKNSPEEVKKFWRAEMDREAEEYRNSPEGRRETTRRQKQLKNDQATVDNLVNTLSGYIQNGLDDVVLWCKRFAEVADNVHLKYDARNLAAVLEHAGYKQNDMLELPQEEYTKRDVFGRYIVGQAIDCMKMGMPPHQVCIRFAEKYEKLPR